MRHISNISDLGLVLRDRRKELGKSASDVAKAISSQRSTIERVENGKMNPTWALLLSISQALDLQPVLVPRERMPAVEAVIKMDTASETPPLAGDDWDE